MKNKIIVIIVFVVAIIGGVVYMLQREEAPVPRPHGFFRINATDSVYSDCNHLPLTLLVNKETVVIAADSVKRADGSVWLNIQYPRLKATVFCTYTPVRKTDVKQHLSNRMERIIMNNRMEMPRSVVFEDTIAHYTAEVFFSREDNVVPLQFLATDSVSFMLTGALYMGDCARPDSIAPSVDAITDDVVHMLQNLRKK